MHLDLYSRWLNSVTDETWMIVAKWGLGFEITAYDIVNLDTEELKRINLNYFHQCVGEEKLIRIKHKITETKTIPPAADNTANQT